MVGTQFRFRHMQPTSFVHYNPHRRTSTVPQSSHLALAVDKAIVIDSLVSRMEHCWVRPAMLAQTVIQYEEILFCEKLNAHIAFRTAPGFSNMQMTC